MFFNFSNRSFSYQDNFEIKLCRGPHNMLKNQVYKK